MNLDSAGFPVAESGLQSKPFSAMAKSLAKTTEHATQ